MAPRLVAKKLRVKNAGISKPGLAHVNGLVKRMIHDKVLGFEDACEYVDNVLRNGTAPGHNIRKWNAFFRLLAELRTMPSGDGYLGTISGIAFTKSGGSARYLAAKGAVAVALDALYGKPFVAADSIASVLNQMVYAGKNEGRDARVSYVIQKFLIPRMKRDIPNNLRLRQESRYSDKVVTVYDTPRQARLYDEFDIQRIARGLDVLSTSIPAHVKILKTVCSKIPYLFTELIHLESQKRTRREGRLIDLIEIYRDPKLCTRVTARIIDQEVWNEIKHLDDFFTARVFLKDTLVDPAHLSPYSTHPSTRQILQERIAANARNRAAKARARAKAKKLPNILARKWRLKTAR